MIVRNIQRPSGIIKRSLKKCKNKLANTFRINCQPERLMSNPPVVTISFFQFSFLSKITIVYFIGWHISFFNRPHQNTRDTMGARFHCLISRHFPGPSQNWKTSTLCALQTAQALQEPIELPNPCLSWPILEDTDWR